MNRIDTDVQVYCQLFGRDEGLGMVVEVADSRHVRTRRLCNRRAASSPGMMLFAHRAVLSFGMTWRESAYNWRNHAGAGRPGSWDKLWAV